LSDLGIPVATRVRIVAGTYALAALLGVCLLPHHYDARLASVGLFVRHWEFAWAQLTRPFDQREPSPLLPAILERNDVKLLDTPHIVAPVVPAHPTMLLPSSGLTCQQRSQDILLGILASQSDASSPLVMTALTKRANLVTYGQWSLPGATLGMGSDPRRWVYLTIACPNAQTRSCPAIVIDRADELNRSPDRPYLHHTVRVVALDSSRPNHCLLAVKYRWVTNGFLRVEGHSLTRRVDDGIVQPAREDPQTARLSGLMSPTDGLHVVVCQGSLAFFEFTESVTDTAEHHARLIVNTFDSRDLSTQRVAFDWDPQNALFRGPMGGEDQWFQVDQAASLAFEPAAGGGSFGQ